MAASTCRSERSNAGSRLGSLGEGDRTGFRFVWDGNIQRALNRTAGFRFCAGGLLVWDTGCIWLTCRWSQMYLSPIAGRKMIFDVGFVDKTHGSSSRSVAYLHDARLEQSLDCRRREGEAKTCFEHTPSWVGVRGSAKGGHFGGQRRPAPCQTRPAMAASYLLLAMPPLSIVSRIPLVPLERPTPSRASGLDRRCLITVQFWPVSNVTAC